MLLTLSYALMRRVRFQLGPGLIRPTQLVFVPMLFLTPAAAVPAAGGARRRSSASCPTSSRRRAHPERLLVIVADGWYAVGPALVIAALAGGAAYDAAWARAAARARRRRSPSTSAPRPCASGSAPGISPGELLPVLALVYLIDATLAPIGFLAVLASEVHEYAYLLAIAPGRAARA